MISFPNDGPSVGSDVTRLSPSTFNLAAVGTYMVQSQVSVQEQGQLVIALDGIELFYTVAGRATGTSQIVIMALVETTMAGSTLSIQSPLGNSNALTIAPQAGGRSAVSAHLLITRME